MGQRLFGCYSFFAHVFYWIHQKIQAGKSMYELPETILACYAKLIVSHSYFIAFGDK
jgi:phosphatidylinositol kinase/protein kinase (PI-3  family)